VTTTVVVLVVVPAPPLALAVDVAGDVVALADADVEEGLVDASTTAEFEPGLLVVVAALTVTVTVAGFCVIVTVTAEGDDAVLSAAALLVAVAFVDAETDVCSLALVDVAALESVTVLAAPAPSADVDDAVEFEELEFEELLLPLAVFCAAAFTFGTAREILFFPTSWEKMTFLRNTSPTSHWVSVLIVPALMPEMQLPLRSLVAGAKSRSRGSMV